MTIRALAADKLIYKAVIGKAGAIALNPVTAVDLFTGAVMDIAMILALSRLYGIPMTKSGTMDLLRKIAWSMGGITGSELLVSLGLSSLSLYKMLPFALYYLVEGIASTAALSLI